MIKDNFWPSYADLMTSLFFVMMVLYVLTFVKLKHDQDIFRVDAQRYQKLKDIEKSLSYLDQEYFEFDDENKRYRMKTDMQFRSGSYDINDIPDNQRSELREAGRELYELISTLAKDNPDVSYVIVLEGNTAHQKINGVWNYESMPDLGYNLSYSRALSLYNFWRARGYDFKGFDNCEILIAGSGYFGKSRDKRDESKNKKFTIQITGNIGQFK